MKLGYFAFLDNVVHFDKENERVGFNSRDDADYVTIQYSRNEEEKFL